EGSQRIIVVTSFFFLPFVVSAIAKEFSL
ncbi:MAG: hypothetical protein ACJAQT_003446, partial [Akkermansiaceae bacterium]